MSLIARLRPGEGHAGQAEAQERDAPAQAAAATATRSRRALLLTGIVLGALLACTIGLAISSLKGLHRTRFRGVAATGSKDFVIRVPVLRLPRPHPLAGHHRLEVHRRFWRRYTRAACRMVACSQPSCPS